MDGPFKLVLRAAVLSAICFTGSMAAQNGEEQITSTSVPVTASRRHSSKTAPIPGASKAELEELERLVAEQHQAEQQRIETLRSENQQLAQQLKKTQEDLAAAQVEIRRITREPDPQVLALQTEVAAIKSAESATTTTVKQQQEIQQERASPVLRYRGVTISPGGYFAAEALYRSHAENADINTSWSGFPYTSQTMARLSEFRASARQTRISLSADSTIRNVAVTGYFETDFLGSGFGASEAQTNGYSNRIRQMWARVQFPSGWTFTGGQMWSLITTNRVGIENLTEMSPSVVDGASFVGFDYARQNSFRLTRRFLENKAAVAFSAENAATVGITPGNVPSSISGSLSGLSTTGTGALSNTTYSTNVAPDLLAKVAFDPGYGHYELKLIGRTFRDRLNSTATTPGHNNTLLNGAIGAAAYFPFATRKANLLAQATWGAMGRYGATGTDVIVKPDGGLSAEKSLHAIVGFDVHPTPRLDWFGYAADEYLPRNYGYGLKTVDNSKCFLETGYSCSANIRDLEGGVTGIWYRFYKGPAGTVQYGFNYIYLVKNTWTGVGGAPRGIESIGETSFRYYIP